MRDVLNSEEFAEETETHRVINTLRPAQRQSVILLTVHYMFKHRLWNFNGLACGRLTINVGDLDLICLCRECVFVFQRISLCLVSCHIPGHKQR